jgi:hypothetical protein
MHMANFGTASIWPLYTYFLNLSKYVRARHTSGTCHHIAYIPSVHQLDVLLCADGILRHVFPCIFTYSADYPEKYAASPSFIHSFNLLLTLLKDALGHST